MQQNTQRPRILQAGVACCLLWGLLTGCTTNSAQPETPPAALGAQPVTVAWSSKENLVSKIHVIQPRGLAIAYVERKGSLALVARDPNDGSQRWKREASIGRTPGGIALAFPVIERDGKQTMAMLEPIGEESEQLVIIDLATGENIAKAFPTTLRANRPTDCDGSWCIEAYTSHGVGKDLRYDWDDQRWNPVSSRELPTPKKKSSDRLIDEGLSSSQDRGENQEILSYARNGRILWSIPYEQIFDRYYSTDHGWEWEMFNEPHQTYVGSGSRMDYQYTPEGDAYVRDWSTDQMLVGLEPETGKRRWALPGAALNCASIANVRAAQTRSSFVTCRFHQGLTTVRPATGWTEGTTGLKWDVASIDATTGEVLWSHELPEYDDAVDLADANKILGDQKYTILPLKSGLAAVDIATGAKAELSEVLGPIVLCEIEREPVDIKNPTKESGKTNLNLGESVEPCTRDDLKPTKELPLFAEFQRIGLDKNPIEVLASRNGMVAYKMPER